MMGLQERKKAELEMKMEDNQKKHEDAKLKHEEKERASTANKNRLIMKMAENNVRVEMQNRKK